MPSIDSSSHHAVHLHKHAHVTLGLNSFACWSALRRSFVSDALVSCSQSGFWALEEAFERVWVVFLHACLFPAAFSLSSSDFEAFLCTLKGQYTQKNKHSVVYSPSCCSNPIWVSLFCWTQKKIFRRTSETKHLLVAIDFYSMGENAVEVTADDRIFIFGWTVTLNTLVIGVMISD